MFACYLLCYLFRYFIRYGIYYFSFYFVTNFFRFSQSAFNHEHWNINGIIKKMELKVKHKNTRLY